MPSPMVHEDSITVAVFRNRDAEAMRVDRLRYDLRKLRRNLYRMQTEGAVRACYEASVPATSCIRGLRCFAAQSNSASAPDQERLVKSVLAATTPIGIAALGGALAVFGGYDDSPGGTLLGLALVLGAMTFGARSAWRRQ